MKKFIIFLLILSMLAPYSVFAATIEADSKMISEDDYKAIDAMWQELFSVETKGLSDTESAQKVAKALTQNELYIDGSIRWNGEDHFTFETTVGVTCGYSARLQEIAQNNSENNELLAQPATQTYSYAEKNTAARDIFLIEPYIGIDEDFTDGYQKECQNLAKATGGTYHLYAKEAATVDAIADAIEQGAVVIFDTHGSTDYESGEDFTSGARTSYILLQTGAGLTTSDYAYDTVSGVYHAVNYGVSANDSSMYLYAVDGTCIANHMDADAPNSLLWMASCLSMATDGLCAPLRQKGVEVAYGYSQSVTFSYEYLWKDVFFREMKAGATVASAIAMMKAEVGQWDWCHECTTYYSALVNDCAFPIVVSSADPYPGHGNVDNLQTVYSTWTLSQAGWPDIELPGDCLHSNLQTTVLDPTCTEDGYSETYCADCLYVLVHDPLPATGHSYVGAYCSVCGMDSTLCPHEFSDGSCLHCGAFDLNVGSTRILNAKSAEVDFIGYTWQVADPTIVSLGNSFTKPEYSNYTVQYVCNVEITGIRPGSTILTLYDRNGNAWGTALIVVEQRTCAHTFDAGIEAPVATCESDGIVTYTCLLCAETTTAIVPATGHSYEEYVITEPTCTNPGVSKFICNKCDDSYELPTDKIPHFFVGNQCNVCDGFCVEVGETLYLTYDFYDDSVYNYTWELADPTLAVLSNPNYTEELTEDGTVKYFNIEVLGVKAGETEIFLKGYDGEKLPPARLIVLSNEEHTHRYDLQAVEATCTTDAYSTYTCTCGDSLSIIGEPSFGHLYVGGTCAHCGQAEPGAGVVSNPFIDVKGSDYFYSPVLWAIGHGVTNGTSATTFSPNADCTRGQIVTFLWRACGSPEPTSSNNPFTDVKSSDYYYKAVLWAVEKGITTGLSATKFGPNATCTRGQVATFLWRSQGEPAPTSVTIPFNDVKTSEYYCNAVLWAVENHITEGVGFGRFAPNAGCTRGQIVTFLFRAVSQ